MQNPRSPQQIADSTRKRILETAFRANKGHLGSALSICELITATALTARKFGTDHPARDRVVLSKGHASLALYCILVELGHIAESDLASYCKDGSLLQTHPDRELKSVEFSTGSLGQGIGFATGLALASKIRTEKYRTFVILSDSELNEGSTWESIAMAGTQCLASLTVLLDLNGQQALGYTNDVLKVGDPSKMFFELGWNVVNAPGHDAGQLTSAIQQTESSTKPSVIIAQTTAGRGVSFMERRIEWHYLPMTSEQFQTAMSEQSGQ